MLKQSFTRFFLPLFYLGCIQPAFAQYPVDCCSNEEMCYSMPCYEGESKWRFAADLLYWSTDFNAISEIGVAVQTTETTADAHLQVKQAKQRWDPGVRLTAGWIGCDDWDISAGWTNFYNSTSNHRTPFQLQIDTDNLNAGGSSKRVFIYNVADFELGKTLCMCPNFLIRPFMGVHAVWLRLNTKLNVLVPETETQDPFALDIHLNKRVWGVGPRIGVNTLWGNFNGFSLVTNIACSLVYGKHETRVKAEVDVSDDLEINIFAVGGKQWRLMTALQMQSGIAYTTYLFDKEIKLCAMWECNSISEANNILIFNRSINTQGLTARVEFGF